MMTATQSKRLSSILADLWPDILAYVVSFVTLGVYWVAHHRIFRWILYADRALIWINISFLMTIGLILFSTALLTQNMNEQLSIFVYAFNSILAGLIIFALYYHAKENPDLIDKTVHILIRKRSGRDLQ